MVLQNVYHGLRGIERGTVKRLRIVAIPAKTQPWMNRPSLGATRDDPGKCVLGTVPVEADGSAHFRMPAGVNVLFQALDARGRAVQTMRTATYVQAGQTLSCIGCHEPRTAAPASGQPRAATREPSRIAVGPEGSWPLRFDRLVQPVLDKHCLRCHRPGGEKPGAARIDLRGADRSYAALGRFGGKGSVHAFARRTYSSGRSVPGDGAAMTSPLLAMFLADKPHNGVRLDADALDRLTTWLDAYGQRLGSFSDAQEAQLRRLRADWADLLIERGNDKRTALQGS
jgi:mono/diheme cytochrome c family protein